MPTPCTVPALEVILKGDAVCVTGYDAGNSQPIVKRASRANLATSKTVFGVAEDDDDGFGLVSIRVAGEVCEDDITSLGNVGGSRIIATDINNASGLEEDQCRLIRVDRPDGSEHVVGACDENGHLAVQPRASRDTSAEHVFNVKSYGAIGDGLAADRDAINAAATAAAVVAGRLFFPPGAYRVESSLTIPNNVHILFDEGASLEPDATTVTIEGRVTCHPHQRIFGGTGTITAPVDVVGTPPAITISGDPVVKATINIRVVAPGALGTMTFQFTTNGVNWSTERPSSGLGGVGSNEFPMPGLGVTVTFTGGMATYATNDEWSFSATPSIVLARESFHLLSVQNFGAVPNDSMAGAANLLAFRKCLGASDPDSSSSTVRVLADGKFDLSGTLHVVRPILMEGKGQVPNAESDPGTKLIFPTNCTGLRFHSGDPKEFVAAPSDPTGSPDGLPDGLPILFVGAAHSELRNVSIYCKDVRAEVPSGPPWRDDEDEILRPNVPPYDAEMNFHTGHGIHTSAVIVLRSVIVQNFAEHGVYVAASFDDSGSVDPLVPAIPGNAGGSHLVNVVSGAHGGHGFFFFGGDANVSLIEMCVAALNWGNGFRDDGGSGNTYVGCYTQGNAGMLHGEGEPDVTTDLRNHDYYTIGVNRNGSTFLGCYSEASVDRIIFPASAFGGTMSGATFAVDDSAGLGMLGGRMSGGPLQYWPRTDFPNGSAIAIGAPPTRPDEALRFGRVIAGALRSPTWLTHDGKSNRWTLYNESVVRAILELPTLESNDRLGAPAFPNGLFIGTGEAGSTEDPSGIDRRHWRMAPAVPETQPDLTPATYKRGDVVWNSETSLSELGRVCLVSGTWGNTVAAITADTTTADPDVDVSANTDLSVGQYISIAGAGDHLRVTGVGTSASLVSGAAETYDLSVGIQTLQVWIDLRGVQTITFDNAPMGGDFADPAMATAMEVAAALNTAFTLFGGGSASADGAGGVVTITSNSRGLDSRVVVTGGSANAALQFSKTAATGTADTTKISVTPAPSATVVGAALDYAAPTFAPFGTTAAGQRSIDMVNANRTLTDVDVYGVAVINATNSNGMTLFFPAPADEEHSYQRTVRAPDDDLVVDVVGGGVNAITILAGNAAIIGFDASGAYRITPDTAPTP